MNSSNNKSFFTAEELGSVIPWRVPSVDEDSRSGTAVSSSPVVIGEEDVESIPRLTADEIEAMQRQAYEEAAAQGREAGLKQGHEEGYRAGYEAGLERGLAQGEGEVGARMEALEQILASLDQPLRDVDEQVEQELVALATALARQLIRRELKSDPGQIIAVVREAMSALPSSARKINLVLHPEDAELVRSTLSLDEGRQRWKLVEDPLLTRGGCHILSENSTIDATVEKRLTAAIARAFGGERGGDGR